MTNLQVIQAFINGKAGKSLNMTSDGKRLFSYNTVIAQHCKHGEGKIIINFTRYSSTTSKQRNYLVRELSPSRIYHTDEVPMGAQYLGGQTL